MSTLMDAVKGMVTDQLVGAVAGKLDEDGSAISKAIGGLAPTILSGIAGQAEDPDRFGAIFDMLNDEKVAAFGDNPAALIEQGNLAQDDPKDMAGQLMGSLFGDKVGPILGALAAFAGLKKGSSSGLLGMVGPMVMSMLAKKVLGGGTSKKGLMDILLGEKKELQAAVPDSIGDILGYRSHSAAPAVAATAAAAAPAAAAAVRDYEEDDDKGGMGWLGWLLPLLLLGAAAFWWMNRGGTDTAPDPAPTPPVEAQASETVVVEEPMPDVDVAEASQFERMIGDYQLIGNANGAEAALLGFIESDKAPCTDADCWFTMDRVTFNSGSSELDMDKSTNQLTNIVRIMEANPGVQLKLGGYTDNTGSEQTNMTISQARADAVAMALIGMGIDSDRVVAEGYGPQFPVASNDTEDGRAQNRRIDVRVRAR
jgi:outer membrane protein OmpA-like peptidoglycan-associated protein